MEGGSLQEGGSVREGGERDAATPSPPPPPPPQATIQSLPPEMLIHLLSYLSPTDLCHTVPRVCRLWEELHQDRRLYRVLSFTPRQSRETLIKCMRLATCLQSFTLVAHDIREILPTLRDLIAKRHLGKHLRSFSLKLTSQSDHCFYNQETQMDFQTELLCRLNNCSSLEMLHLELSSVCTSTFFKHLADLSCVNFNPNGSHRGLRVVRFVNMKSVPELSDKCFVTRCLHLEELSVFSDRDEWLLSPILFTGNELSGLCERLCGTLRVLHLNYGDWSAQDLSSLSTCHCLQDLCFYKADKLSDEGLLVIASLTGLRKLKIKDCRKPMEVSWIRMVISPALKSLEALVLDRCSISNETSLAIGANMRNLKKVYLKRWDVDLRAQISPLIFPTGFKSIIKGCPNLEALSLSLVDPVSLSAVILIPQFLPRLQRLSIAPWPNSKCTWIIVLKARMPHLRITCMRNV